jgi:hypothetical protein
VQVFRELRGSVTNDAVERLHAPAPQEIHYVRRLLDPTSVYELVLAARLHERPVALPYVYEADGQGIRGRRSTADVPTGHESAVAREEEQERQERREEASTRHHAKLLEATFLRG